MSTTQDVFRTKNASYWLWLLKISLPSISHREQASGKINNERLCLHIKEEKGLKEWEKRGRRKKMEAFHHQNSFLSPGVVPSSTIETVCSKRDNLGLFLLSLILPRTQTQPRSVTTPCSAMAVTAPPCYQDIAGFSCQVFFSSVTSSVPPRQPQLRWETSTLQTTPSCSNSAFTSRWPSGAALPGHVPAYWRCLLTGTWLQRRRRRGQSRSRERRSPTPADPAGNKVHTEHCRQSTGT